MNDSSTLVASLLTLAVIANSLIGGLVVLRGSRRDMHAHFFLMTLASTAWIGTNLLFLLVPQRAFLFALLSYSAAALLALTFFLFALDIGGYRLSAFQRRTIILLGLTVTIISAIPGVLATGVSSSLAIETNAPSLTGYGLYLMVYIGAGLAALVTAYLKARRGEKRMIGVVLAGFGSTAFIALLTNLILPLSGNYQLVGLGPVATLLFVFASSYAIIKHRLFDIKTIAARSIAYLGVLVLVATLYATFIYAAATFIYPDSAPTTGQYVINVILAVGVALVFQPLKQLFDILTDKVFFRDTYTPQLLLDRVGQDIASTATPHQLLRAVSHHIRHGLKVNKVAVYWYDTDHFYGTAHERPKSLPVKEIDEYVRRRGGEFIDVDEIYAKDLPLYEHISSQGIGYLVRLRTAKRPVGYLCIGIRQGASSLTWRDRQALQVIAGELAVAMQNALRLDEIKQFNETLRQKINDATRELRRSNRQLHELDKTKDEFISMASHQLRTPLTTIKGYLSMVLEGDVGKVSPMQRKLLGEAFDSSQRMSYLITDFLNVSRLQTGKFELERAPADLNTILGQEIDQLKSIAGARQIKIRFTPETVPSMDIDEGKVRQVMMNFIDNAIYYSPSHSTVSVDLKATDGGAAFTVTDQGIGVPESEKDGLFTKFYRASNARKQRPDGTGIGLFMAKKVIDAHGGEIIFKSKEGKGSTFGFRLPLKG